MTVIINSRLAPASSGVVRPTGTAFVAAAVGGDLTKPYLVRSNADFESFYNTRSGGGAIGTLVWDWLDYAFKEGLKQAYIGSYTGTNYNNGLALFDSRLGGGQVTVLGDVSAAATIASDLWTHASANKRFAMMDVAQGASLSAMQTQGDGLPSSAPDQGALFGPWLSVPPPNGVVGGTERLVPASAAFAAVCANVDAAGNPNRAPGGRDFFLANADGVSLDSTDAQAATALTHKVNLVRLVNGVLQIDSWRTALPFDPSTPYYQINAARTRMWMQHYAAILAQPYRGRPVNNTTLNALKGDLKTMLLALFKAGAFYADNPADAFDVNVGAAVNTAAQAATAQITAVCQAQMAPSTETVEIDLVTVPVTANVISS